MDDSDFATQRSYVLYFNFSAFLFMGMEGFRRTNEEIG